VLQDDCVFLNHGAFGGVLKEALETAQVCALVVILIANPPFKKLCFHHLDTYRFDLVCYDA